MTSFAPVEDQLAILRRGAVDLIGEEELGAKLERSRQSGRPLVVKVGFDPSAPDIHLGHTVVMRKMKQFQDFGHEIVFVVGDFTAMIGDPSGTSKTRPQLTREQVLEHAETYRQQAFKILDEKKTRLEFNSSWLEELGAAGFINLAGKYTVARMLERDDFERRFKANLPIGVHEFLYPLAQAYDSVALGADVEMGGTDQLFNLLVGRDIMREHGQEPQVVLTVPLLVGTDGVEKMSKSLGNYIAVEDPPQEMFGKVMSVSDELMWAYYELCTSVAERGIAGMKNRVATGELHPKVAKQALARAVVEGFYGTEAATAAQAEFDTVFARGGLPDAMPERAFDDGENVGIVAIMRSLDFVRSNSEGRRLLAQGAVSLDGKRIESHEYEVEADGCERVLKVGKRRFARVTVS